MALFVFYLLNWNANCWWPSTKQDENNSRARQFIWQISQHLQHQPWWNYNKSCRLTIRICFTTSKSISQLPAKRSEISNRAPRHQHLHVGSNSEPIYIVELSCYKLRLFAIYSTRNTDVNFINDTTTTDPLRLKCAQCLQTHTQSLACETT